MDKHLQSEKERLKYNIDRFDHLYDSINNKSNVYLVINTFVIGGLASLFLTNQDKIPSILWVKIILICLSVLGILSIIFTILASMPKLSKTQKSMYYFGGIGSYALTDFINHSQNRSEEDDINDLRTQVYELSIGLTRKFKRLKTASTLLVIQFIISLLTIILLITHLIK